MSTVNTDTTSSSPTGITSPDVVKETNGVFSVVSGGIGDLISPTSTLRQSEANAVRCAIYFALGYLLAR